MNCRDDSIEQPLRGWFYYIKLIRELTRFHAFLLGVQYIKSDVETRKTSIIHCLVFGAKMEQFDFEFDFEHDLSADVGQPAEAPQSMPPSARKNYRQVRSEWGLVA